MSRFLRLTALVLLILSYGSFADATLVVPLNLKQMTARADRIFMGTCREINEELDENGIPVTYVSFDVEQVLKGAVAKREVLKFYGVSEKKILENTGLVFDQRPAAAKNSPLDFKIGDHEVLFLYKDSPLGFTSPVGWGQGRFDISDGPVPTVINRFYHDLDAHAETAAALPAIQIKKTTDPLGSAPVTLDSFLKTLEKETRE